MTKPTLILWDWNGTLLDDLDLCVESLNWLLKEFGYPQRYDTDQYREIVGFPIIDYYRRAGFDFSRDSFEVLAHRYMEHYIPESEACGPAAGAEETLVALSKAGAEQVILSASPLPTLRRQARQLGLEGYFSTLLGLGDIYAKSKVELGLDFLRRRGFAPEEALMVGDTVHDWEVAQALGVRCVLCSAGHQPAHILRATGAPVISCLSQLEEVL